MIVQGPAQEKKAMNAKTGWVLLGISFVIAAGGATLLWQGNVDNVGVEFHPFPTAVLMTGAIAFAVMCVGCHLRCRHCSRFFAGVVREEAFLRAEAIRITKHRTVGGKRESYSVAGTRNYYEQKVQCKYCDGWWSREIHRDSED